MTIFKIETIKDSNNNEVSFCPLRGGMITSLKFKGKEILYFDEETFNSGESSVRGGIPILFPNAGELVNNTLFPELKRHGFARDFKWQREEHETGFKESLYSSVETREIFPFDFKLSLSGQFENDGSFTLVQEVENLEEEKDMPISMGLHPYFNVLNTEKGYIKFYFQNGREIEDGADVWSDGGTIYIDNPKIKDKNSLMKVEIPSLGTLAINASVEYEKFWIWSMPGKDFICIEPMMKGLNGMVDDPYILKPGSSVKIHLNIRLI